jgi:hypothetical protein
MISIIFGLPFQPRDQAGLIPSVSVVPSDLMMGRGSELRAGWVASMTQLVFTFDRWANSCAVRISMASIMKLNTENSDVRRNIHSLNCAPTVLRRQA